MPAARPPLRSASPSPSKSPSSSRPGTPKSGKGKAKSKKSKAAPASNEGEVASPLDVDATVALAEDGEADVEPETAAEPSTQVTTGAGQQLNGKENTVTKGNIYGKLRGRIYMR